jgi:hypothetical protein
VKLKESLRIEISPKHNLKAVANILYNFLFLQFPQIAEEARSLSDEMRQKEGLVGSQ